MKKSNKISVFYFVFSVALLLVLFFGGIYGVYVSVGLNFVRGSAVNIAETGRASNVAFGGTVNFESSMSGVIILSIVLVILAVFDIVALVKQVVFFKQFKVINESTLEQVIERKIKSKKSVIVFAFIIDILSLVAGVLGIFFNARTFVRGNNIWLLYIMDGLVSIFALFSFVFLILKLKRIKRERSNGVDNNKGKNLANQSDYIVLEDVNMEKEFDINEVEYSLLKLKHLKSCKIINNEEFEYLRLKILNIKQDENFQNKNKAQ